MSEEITQQSIFNAVVTHLRKQGRKASKGPGGLCMYRTEKGLKCAAGCLLTDEEYDPRIEGGTVNTDYMSTVIGKAFARYEGHFGLISSLQQVHDLSDPKEWEARLQLLADSRGLVMP